MQNLGIVQILTLDDKYSALLIINNKSI